MRTAAAIFVGLAAAYVVFVLLVNAVYTVIYRRTQR